jgi:ppGpp synthetase/RelA/SpoT-type nucleotidyltranferase
MKWREPKGYNSKEIDWAGEVLINDNHTAEEYNKAFEILDNWRAIHSYPMHVFKMRLKRKLPNIDNEGFGVQRLKRIPAIINKLNRSKIGHMRKLTLSQMQDIGGCRAVLSDVSLVKKFAQDYFIKSELKHKRYTEKDFITKPRHSGYRGLHLIYKFYSDKGKNIYNGLLVEIQIRSRLQHLWSTAVETVGFFISQAIKSSEADTDWLDFFKLVSSAFALIENCPCIKDTPTDEKELYLQIKQKESQLKVIKIMRGWRRALKIFKEESRKNKKYQYYLLELNIPEEKLTIISYTKSEESEAIKKYSEIEKKNKGKKEYDVVLVSADTSTDLEKAYPNYFLDADEFLEHLKEIINKY